METKDFMQQFMQIMLDHAKKSGLSVSLLAFYIWFNQGQTSTVIEKYETKLTDMGKMLVVCNESKEKLEAEVAGLTVRVDMLSIQSNMAFAKSKHR